MPVSNYVSMSDAERERFVRDDLANNHTYQEIAIKLGTTKGTISKWLKKWNLRKKEKAPPKNSTGGRKRKPKQKQVPKSSKRAKGKKKDRDPNVDSLPIETEKITSDFVEELLLDAYKDEPHDAAVRKDILTFWAKQHAVPKEDTRAQELNMDVFLKTGKNAAIKKDEKKNESTYI